MRDLQPMGLLIPHKPHWVGGISLLQRAWGCAPYLPAGGRNRIYGDYLCV